MHISISVELVGEGPYTSFEERSLDVLRLRLLIVSMLTDGGLSGRSLCLPVVVTMLPRTLCWVLAENHC